ncbi:hypothetical protein PSTT_08986 [Puccinia striiformis]|uniref:Uncharacterized protein n=1 Tax=Puccinia striiformis TaxID=27350 RepID=A0A2S4VA81_9BASI|nr:hypothetical protein PSTT_08986 [Puccinia striiformis]
MSLKTRKNPSSGQAPRPDPTNLSPTRFTPSTLDGSVRSQRFRYTDFENICTYLESAEHYDGLFGHGAKLAKPTAFNLFADAMNELNPSLQITRRGLRHRLVSYKQTYLNAKNHQDQAADDKALDEGDGITSLAGLLDRICPCFERMDRIFGQTVDIRPILEVEHPLSLNSSISVTKWVSHQTIIYLAMGLSGLAIIMMLTSPTRHSSSLKTCLVRITGGEFVTLESDPPPSNNWAGRALAFTRIGRQRQSEETLPLPALFRNNLRLALNSANGSNPKSRFPNTADSGPHQAGLLTYPSLSQGPSPFSSAEHEEPLPLGPLQSTATTPSPSKAKQPAKKKGAQGKAGAKSKGVTYQITRAQKAKLKRDHRQGIRDMMDDQDSLPERATRRKTPKSAQASPKEDGGKHFVRADFENICTYLKNAQHFTDLFGDGAKTTVSAGKVSKVKAFEVFAVWMNQLNPGLLLNGRRLQQRFTSYKAKYSAAEHREDGTGGGVEEKDGDKSLAEVMEDMCPCFARLDAIFREKANITPMFEFDHSMIDATIEEDLSDASSEEILFEGWEPTQSQAPVPLAQSISPSDPAAAPHSQIDLDQLCPPLPDLTDLLAGSANNLAPAPPSPARGPAPPLPASAPATMLNPPLPAGPGSPMPQMLMHHLLLRRTSASLTYSRIKSPPKRRWEEAEARAERDRAREDQKEAREAMMMQQRLNLEEARMQRQEAQEAQQIAAALAQEQRLRNDKKAMVNDMLQAGNSAAEIAALVRVVFG